MNVSRGVLYASVGVIVITTLASGPLVPWVTFPSTDSQTDEGSFATGSATIVVDELPTGATLERGDFGAGNYHTRVADTQLHIKAVSGRPLVVYKLRIPALGHARSSTYVIDESWLGERALALEPSTLSPDRIDRESYQGELVVLIRSDEGERILGRTSITITVQD